MCELLGMNANVPTDICFSFTGLIQRGGKTGPHKDGWGITFYEGKGCRTFRDPQPGAGSEIAQLVKRYPIKSEIVVSHIRKASHGKVCLKNTHPFNREMWGQYWTFAHNGKLKGIKTYPLKRHRAVGSTDSEHAFCWLLDQCVQTYASAPTNKKALWEFMSEKCRQLASLGTFNMLMSDSSYVYAFCSTKLCWITREAPFGKAALIDEEMEVNFKEETTEKDVVTIIATRPLTGNEQWQHMKKNTFYVFRRGRLAVSL